MVRKDSYFYFSGFFSLLIVVLTLVLFLYMLIKNEKIKSFALKKDSFVSISLNNIPTTVKNTKKSEVVNEQKVVKPKESSTSEVKESKSEPIPDVSSLFSSVNTQKVEKVKKEEKKVVDENRVSTIAKRLKTKSENEVQSTYEKMKNMKLAQPTVEVSSANSASTGSEVNEYLAKIQALVYEQFFPPASTEGSIAKVRIWLTSSGKVEDFRILTYSNSGTFNEEVDALKERLSTLTFPEHPKKEASVIDIVLTAEG